MRDLFYATPARLKFLKAPRTEYAHAAETVQRLAMAHPGVAFSVSDGTRTTLRLGAAQGDLFTARLDRLGAIMGRDFQDNALKVDASVKASGSRASRACRPCIGGRVRSSTSSSTAARYGTSCSTVRCSAYADFVPKDRLDARPLSRSSGGGGRCECASGRPRSGSVRSAWSGG